MKHGAKLLYGSSSACWWMVSVFLTGKWASGHPCHVFGLKIHNMDLLLLHLYLWCETHLPSLRLSWSTISKQLFITCLSLRTKKRQICNYKCNLLLRLGSAQVMLLSWWSSALNRKPHIWNINICWICKIYWKKKDTLVKCILNYSNVYLNQDLCYVQDRKKTKFEHKLLVLLKNVLKCLENALCRVPRRDFTLFQPLNVCPLKKLTLWCCKCIKKERRKKTPR